MSEVTVVGAGFSGLTLAYYLNRYGLRVTVVEKDSRPGGLISTQNTEYGLVETAANALLCDADIEKLFADLELGFAYQPRERKNRYIFWKKPRRWPLSLWTSVKLVKLMIMARLGFKGFEPVPRESVQVWARRLIGVEFEERGSMLDVYDSATGELLFGPKENYYGRLAAERRAVLEAKARAEAEVRALAESKARAEAEVELERVRALLRQSGIDIQ